MVVYMCFGWDVLVGVAEGRRLKGVPCMWYAGRLKVVVWLMMFHRLEAFEVVIFFLRPVVGLRNGHLLGSGTGNDCLLPGYDAKLLRLLPPVIQRAASKNDSCATN
jgi:hypothetical protein